MVSEYSLIYLPLSGEKKVPYKNNTPSQLSIICGISLAFKTLNFFN